MAKALKCDRCGLCFDPYCSEDGKVSSKFSEPAYCTPEDARRLKMTGALFSEYTSGPLNDYYVDLCDKCTRDLWKFMSEKGRSVQPLANEE